MSGDAERCRYCLEELQYLIEPKRLDCGHVFCKECMSPQILGDGSFQCPTCRWVMMSSDWFHGAHSPRRKKNIMVHSNDSEPL